MMKKFKKVDYARGLSLVVAVFLLFMSMFLLRNEPPLPTYEPDLQGKKEGNPSSSFQFAFLADVHKGWGVFKPIMKDIAKNGYSFAIIGGDIVAQGREDRYRFFFRELEEVKVEIPIYFVPGNHEVFDIYNKYNLDNYHKFCGPDHYWFPWGNAAFVVINDALTKIQKKQFLWLEETLRELKGDFAHIFVIMHIPPFDPREGQSYCLTESSGEKLMALMEKYEVGYVLCGHIHCYFRQVINGVTYIIAGGAGGGLKCPDGFYHYVEVSVGDEGIEDSVIKIKKNRWLQLKEDIKYDMQIRRPFLLPYLTVVMGQSFFYFLTH
jgi:Icc-related predicted phosphoesterase